MGNGESRLAIDYQHLSSHITYGCNAIFRDFNPSALVVIDNKMLHEVVVSRYSKQNKCYFRNFTPMETFHYAPLKTAAGGEIIENQATGYQFAYYGQLKERQFCAEDKTMDLVDRPMHWFTWFTKDDQIYNLDDYIGDKLQDSGQNATELMATIEKPDVCYLIGFDLSNNDGLVNNLYKNSDGYAPDYALAVPAEGWIRDLDIIFDKYPQTTFIHVQDVKVFNTIETISVNQFINRLER
jgi:hypothetical protein